MGGVLYEYSEKIPSIIAMLFSVLIVHRQRDMSSKYIMTVFGMKHKILTTGISEEKLFK